MAFWGHLKGPQSSENALYFTTRSMAKCTHVWSLWMIFSGAKSLDLWLLGTDKGISLLIKLLFWGLHKGPSGPEMGQWCLSSNAWPVCTVWNQIWCHKDFQRGKSALYGVIVILTWFPPYCGSTCSLWNHYPIKMMQQRGVWGWLRNAHTIIQILYIGLVKLFLILDILPL